MGEGTDVTPTPRVLLLGGIEREAGVNGLPLALRERHAPTDLTPLLREMRAHSARDTWWTQ